MLEFNSAGVRSAGHRKSRLIQQRGQGSCKGPDLLPQHRVLAVVQDADRLDSIRAFGITRFFIYHANSGDTLDESMTLHQTLEYLEGLMKTRTGREMETVQDRTQFSPTPRPRRPQPPAFLFCGDVEFNINDFALNHTVPSTHLQYIPGHHLLPCHPILLHLPFPSYCLRL